MLRPFAIVAVALIRLTTPVAAQTYNSAADFSTASNPTGAWAYGYSPVGGFGQQLTIYANTSQNNGAGYFKWTVDPGANVPYAAKNLNSTHFTTADSNVLPGQFTLHAGSVGSTSVASVLRFTAPTQPTAGTYSLSVTFEKRTTNTGWPVAVYRGTNQLFAASFTGTLGDQLVYNPSTPLTLSSGDTIDFLVSPRANNSFNSTTTGVDAVLTFTPVPEPSAVLMASSLAMGCGWAVQRRRRTRRSSRRRGLSGFLGLVVRRGPRRC